MELNNIVNEDVLEDVKTAMAAAGAWIMGEFVNNPIGAISAIVGLLYVWERFRTQRVVRKKAEIDLKKEEENAHE